MVTLIKKKTRNIFRSFLYGVVFVAIGYISAHLPTALGRTHTQQAPTPFPVAFADTPPTGDTTSDTTSDAITGDSGDGSGDGSGGSSDGSGGGSGGCDGSNSGDACGP